MKTFQEFMESLHDPKNNPAIPGWQQRWNDFSPEDDHDGEEVAAAHKDYDFWSDDDENPGHYHRSELGKNANYPLASLDREEAPRGLQVKSPEEIFKPHDKMDKQEYIDTLRSKLYTGEKLTMPQLNYITRILNKEIEATRA